MRSLLVLLVLASGCGLEELIPGAGEHPGGGGGGGGGGGDINGPVPTAVQSTRISYGSGACTGRARCPVAVGGTTLIHGGRGAGVNVNVTQDSPEFALTLLAGEGYLLTARAPALTTLVLTGRDPSDELTELRGEVEALAVDDVGIAPLYLAEHRMLGTQAAWHSSVTEAVVELTARTSPEPTRLVDLSLDTTWASDPAIASTEWDRVSLPTTPNVYSVRVQADSFAERQLSFEMVDSIDRVVPVVNGTLARVGDEAEVCFHPMLGARDVVVKVTFAVGGIAEVGDRPAPNCVRVRATTAGTAQIDANAFGVSASLALTIAP